MLRIGVIYICMKCKRSQCPDETGKIIHTMLAGLGKVVEFSVVAENDNSFAKLVDDITQRDDLDLFMAIGGNNQWWQNIGLTVIKKTIEADFTMLGDAVRQRIKNAYAGRKRRMVIVTVPGNHQGVQGCLEALVPPLEEGLHMIRDSAVEKNENIPVAEGIH